MEIINLDDNLDLTDLIQDTNTNPSPVESLQMIGGAEPTDEPDLEEDEKEEPDDLDFEPVSPPPETAPKTPQEFSAVPPPTGLYDPTSRPVDLVNLLDSATQPQASGIDKLPEEPATSTDIVSGVESVPDGTYVQVEKYIENISGLEYERYLGELEEFFVSSKKKKNKENFDYLVNSEGHFEKRCKPDVDKKSDEIVIIPPKYLKINDALRSLSSDLEQIEFNLREVRDKILLKEKGVTDKEFETLKKNFYEMTERKQIFLNYKNKVNNVDESNKNLLRLSLEKAELRNKLRTLFNEISELNRVPNRDLSLINLKIKEYLELNKINELDREIQSIKSRDHIDYVVTENAKITKPEKPKKRKIVKKKKEGEDEQPEKPKKKKIVRKKKTTEKGGGEEEEVEIDIDELLDTIDEDENENQTEDLREMITADPELEEEQKVFVGGAHEESSENVDLDLDLNEDLDLTSELNKSQESESSSEVKKIKIDVPEQNETSTDEISLGDDLQEVDFDFTDNDTNTNSNSLESVDNFNVESTEPSMPTTTDNDIEELDLGDDLEELSSHDEDMFGGSTEDYSFENTYKEEVPTDKIDNQIPLKLNEEDEPIKVKVVKLGA